MSNRLSVAIVILLVCLMALSFLPVHGEREVYDTVVRPTVIYGNVDVATAKQIVEEHIIGKKLLDNKIIDRL